jgi:hypothetical protein
MEIRGVPGNIPAAYINKQEVDQPKSNEAKVEAQDEFVKSDESAKKVTYDKPKVDQATIEKLHQESDRAFNYLKQIVAQLLERQGLTFRDWSQVKVDEQARVEANALISEGGELSPEKVSDRIVEFAKAISGGDKGKIDTLRDAIDKGFEEAARILGGELPEVSQKTYDLVMEKLDNWIQE